MDSKEIIKFEWTLDFKKFDTVGDELYWQHDREKQLLAVSTRIEIRGEPSVNNFYFHGHTMGWLSEMSQRYNGLATQTGMTVKEIKARMKEGEFLILNPDFIVETGQTEQKGRIRTAISRLFRGE